MRTRHRTEIENNRKEIKMRTYKDRTGFVSTCSKRMVHVLENGEKYPKQYRRYFNEPDTATCNCKNAGKRRVVTTDPVFWGDDKCPYVIGEICKNCKVKYRYSKMWRYACEECEPKEGK